MTPPVAIPAGLLRRPIAHRALHDAAAGRPENGPAAIAAAIAAGYGIECDVQLSSDGQAMVFHDEVLDRLTDETGPVAARRAADLGRVALRHGTDTIPTLPQVLAQVAGRVPLLIEIKDQTGGMGPTDGRLEAAVAAALAGYGGEVAVMSFNPHAVATMARLAPGLALGLTTSAYDPAAWAPLPPATCDRLRAIPDAATLPLSFISHEAADLARPRVADLKAQGVAILCWTITSAAAEAAARRIADNITFEGYPARLDPGIG
jgi:glycerophosphoryl diester phosphodiesterase